MYFFYFVISAITTITLLFIGIVNPYICKEATRLVSLDKKVSKLLISTKKDDGERLLSGLAKYWEKLKLLDKLVRSNKTYYGDSAFYILEKGINNFANSDFNVTSLVETFDWDESKFRLFNETMRNIQRLVTFAISSNYAGKEIFELLRLDQNISSILTSPAQKDADSLLRNLQSFWEKYLSLDKLILKNEQVVIKSAYCLLNQNIPRFIRLSINSTVLGNIFKWNDEELQRFSQCVSDITRLSCIFPEHFLLMIAHLNKRLEDVSYDSELIVDSTY